MNNLGNVHAIPVLAPVDTATTVTEAFTTPIDAGEAAEVEFQLYNGVITGDTIVVKVYADANTSTGDGTAIAFVYSLSAATGTDTKGAWTAATAADGVTLAAADDNKLLRIKIDPQATGGGKPYVYLGIDPGASMTVYLHSVVALVIPRYSQDVPPSLVN